MGKLRDGTEYAGAGSEDFDPVGEPDGDADDREQRLKNLRGHARGQWERENFSGGAKPRQFESESDAVRSSKRSYKMGQKMTRAKDLLRRERGRR